MKKNATIAAQFANDDAERSLILERARLCAALTKAHLLPPQSQDKNAKLPEKYQSVGARGVSNLEGRMLLSLFPAEIPWFDLRPDESLLYAPDADDEMIQLFEEFLYLRRLTAQSVLESSNVDQRRRHKRAGFRAIKRQVIGQVVATGDALEQLTDDYRLKLFRRDCYVTRRDSAGDVLYHIVKESLDPLTLSDERIATAGLKLSDIQEKSVAERMVDIHTRISWQPRDKTWVIEQEVNDHIVSTSEETVSPYFSTPFSLSPGEHYGRGFVEENLGDLRTLNELEVRRLDLLALASKALWAVDESSLVRDEDLEKESGSVIRARVRGGRVDDVAILHADAMREYGMINDAINTKTRDLGKAFLLETETQPRGERVTATQIMRIAQELDGTLGGVYAPIADDQQIPMVQRLMHMLERDNLIAPLPNDAVRVVALTGLAALSQQAAAGRTMSLVQVLAQLGPEAMSRIDMGVLTDILARDLGIFEPGLIKSAERLAEEQQQAMAAQSQMAAQQRAVDVVGNVAESQLTGAP